MDGVAFYSEKTEKAGLAMCMNGVWCSVDYKSKDMCKGNQKMKACIINMIILFCIPRGFEKA